MNYIKIIEDEISKYCNTTNIDAVKYALNTGGHRIRPTLVLAWCNICGGDIKSALPLAISVEMVHTMSLIHDDLPCMDNADTRRGKPSCHKKYGEAIAVLSGDMLLSEAFGNIINQSILSDQQKMEAILSLSYATKLMAEGQIEEFSGGDWSSINKGKTASLIASACELGCIAANATIKQKQIAKMWGYNLGMAYQLMDDINDHDGSVSEIGIDNAKKLLLEYLEKCELDGSSYAHFVLNDIIKAVKL